MSETNERPASSPEGLTVEDEITIVAKAIASGNYAGTTPNIRQLARDYLQLRNELAESTQARERLEQLASNRAQEICDLECREENLEAEVARLREALGGTPSGRIGMAGFIRRMLPYLPDQFWKDSAEEMAKVCETALSAPPSSQKEGR